MPELPEVETIRRGIAPHMIGSARRADRRLRLAAALAGSLDLDARMRGRTIDRVDPSAVPCRHASATRANRLTKT
ncbi:MAG TPA: DNA-formamidopyrimidine glycosylase family protein [Casimicrobiaceae bacterium]|jgi:formamidopyrimidine-DNA glycosylase|nr:DNA-formamidopyrimidine glycosylase family protein [Casimicrobiaceae bacterium]